MMTKVGTFPFGEPITTVHQADQSPKPVFVLGVYASAVHARWVDPSGREKIRAVGVASEPDIFWRGDGVEEILERINIPKSIGSLEPAPGNNNGPSGVALDEQVLSPLNLVRRDTWLCDLVPHSCQNGSQRLALERHYQALATKGELPSVEWPTVPRPLTGDRRRKAILDELDRSQAKYLVLLGDQPIKWFLAHFDNRWQKLSDFGKTKEKYGRLHDANIEGRVMQVLPVVHPRQAAGLGAHDAGWRKLHKWWVDNCPVHVER